MKNIDINKTIDSIKLKWYHEWLATHIYDEGESGFHEQLTKQVVEKYVDRDKIFESVMRNKLEGVYEDLGWGQPVFNRNINKFFKF